mmetsp:Transcript_56177/g.119596  ORF Transcript_56177/g.119596 Transcript_56177/m.119596 type:complete len:331 (-) Transcript_56177:342-1334(-)
MLPTSIPKFVMIMLFLQYLMQVSGMIISSVVAGSFGQFFAASICVMLLVVAFRGLSKEKASISSTIADFSVQKCTCFDERDRPVIYTNIAVMMRKVLHLPEDMLEEQVLDQFDILVRDELPEALTKQMGRYLIPMDRIFVITFLSHIPFAVDCIAALSEEGIEVRPVLLRNLGSITWAAAGSPSILLLGQWLAMQRLHLRTRAAEYCWVVFCMLLATLWMVVLAVADSKISTWGETSDLGVLVYCLYCLSGFLAVCWLGFGGCCCCGVRRQGSSSASQNTSSIDVEANIRAADESDKEAAAGEKAMSTPTRQVEVEDVVYGDDALWRMKI